MLIFINQNNNHTVVILFRFSLSPLYQVWIYVYVIAIMHNILDPCLVSRGDIFLSSISSSSLYLPSQIIWVYIYVIAILHNILDPSLVSILHTILLDPCLASRGDIFPLSIMHSVLRSLLFQVFFGLFSSTSLSCNPYLGSRWRVQRLQKGETEILKQCILILQSLYIYKEPKNHRSWGCIICFFIHQGIYHLLQPVYASSLCTLLQPVSVSSLYHLCALYFLLQLVYASSQFTSHLSIMNHKVWGFILLKLPIHLEIY